MMPLDSYVLLVESLVKVGLTLNQSSEEAHSTKRRELLKAGDLEGYKEEVLQFNIVQQRRQTMIQRTFNSMLGQKPGTIAEIGQKYANDPAAKTALENARFKAVQDLYSLPGIGLTLSEEETFKFMSQAMLDEQYC